MVDLLTAFVGLAVGAGVGVAASYYVFYTRPKPEQVKVVTRDSGGTMRISTVSSAELDKSRREMRTMMVEKDLLQSSLMKIYEAENEGRITQEERETIARRYSDQIKEIQSKLNDVELVVEVGELEKLREDLVNMFQQKVTNLEARLDQAKDRLAATAPEAIKEKPAVQRTEKPTELEKVVEKRAKPEMTESEKRMREIREEIMGAIVELEQIDLDKKQETN